MFLPHAAPNSSASFDARASRVMVVMPSTLSPPQDFAYAIPGWTFRRAGSPLLCAQEFIGFLVRAAFRKLAEAGGWELKKNN